MRFMFPILITLAWLPLHAQTHVPPHGVGQVSTRISSVVAPGKIERHQAPQIELKNGWSDSILIKKLNALGIHSPKLALEVSRRQKSPHAERIALTALFRGLPVLDRDLVVIIKDNRRIDSIDINLPVVTSFDEVTLNNHGTRSRLTQYLSDQPNTETLSVSEAPTFGWVALGEHLLPVADYEVVDAVRLKHFTARMDLSSGQVIGFKERTIN